MFHLQRFGAGVTCWVTIRESKQPLSVCNEMRELETVQSLLLTREFQYRIIYVPQ